MMKNFYWRFSRKIEGEFWIFYKRFPWKKKWMEDIFKGISLRNWTWIHTRASLARAVFSFKTFFDCEWRSHLLSPTTSTSWNEKNRRFWLWKWSESEVKVKWSEVKVKWRQKGSLIFLKLIYIIHHVYTYYKNWRKMCRPTLLWEWSSRQVGELPHEFSKSPSWRGFLKKWSPTCRIKPLGSSFWKLIFLFREKNLQAFFFRKCYP